MRELNEYAAHDALLCCCAGGDGPPCYTDDDIEYMSQSRICDPGLRIAMFWLASQPPVMTSLGTLIGGS